MSSMHRCYLFLVFQLVSRFWIQAVFLFFLVAMAAYVVIYNADSVSGFTTKVLEDGGFLFFVVFSRMILL